jgi:hypothetical protein
VRHLLLDKHLATVKSGLTPAIPPGSLVKSLAMVGEE